METVQRNNALELCIADKINRPNYQTSSVEKNGGDVQSLTLLRYDLSIVINRCFAGEVNHKRPLLNFVCYFGEFLLDPRFVSTAHNNIEALSSKLMTHFKTYSVTATCYQSP